MLYTMKNYGSKQISLSSRSYPSPKGSGNIGSISRLNSHLTKYNRFIYYTDVAYNHARNCP